MCTVWTPNPEDFRIAYADECFEVKLGVEAAPDDFNS